MTYSMFPSAGKHDLTRMHYILMPQRLKDSLWASESCQKSSKYLLYYITLAKFKFSVP